MRTRLGGLDITRREALALVGVTPFVGDDHGGAVKRPNLIEQRSGPCPTTQHRYQMGSRWDEVNRRLEEARSRGSRQEASSWLRDGWSHRPCF
jgi:hypothetical protein